MDDINKVLTKSVSEILPDKTGLAKLMESKKIRVYVGVDPTGSKLHLGHTIGLRKLQEFADLGHEAILLIGTGTVLAGDPSQRAEARKKITQEEIDQNIATWKDQASKILNFDKIQIKYNGDWLSKLGYADILNIASNISATQLFKREMFQTRTDRANTIWTHELLYPLFQGYDSVVMDVDLEIGGTDQTFNMLVGRELQKKMNNREKFVLTTPLINGTNGKPMSKSSGNCIWLDDSATDMYGKIMSLADNQIASYWQNLTDLDPKEPTSLKPLDAKKRLAFEITRQYHGESAAKSAQENFERVFQQGETPSNLPLVTTAANTSIGDFLVQRSFVSSATIAKNMISAGSVDINNVPVHDRNTLLEDGQIVKIGKTKIVKVKVE
ncbi:tyrosine--tRNA ligase [Candidatus Curtissbacteria bacterium]|nr:tyrosine--tRNA ligase [Candidatus Curtissbacteria bacterium]